MSDYLDCTFPWRGALVTPQLVSGQGRPWRTLLANGHGRQNRARKQACDGRVRRDSLTVAVLKATEPRA